ncbi:MAG TPA: Nif3-like dinuclear metal center hexameric protein [Phycisphaerae bacterium]|nr:Nif3-like dinuclear metal center hexameric protein [Phycisphaerae bacterium]HOJ75025.1 Nif3-like dinuclear metal center hexameric protein [Phycisphaerae bacterium]HOM51896.1 Nif3-like dinuclear metal center hexameric protein [Phycisphaerae bacterium]HON67584.1 Nif3-like dinuclear metal center hexameric protein [Phycisphaerae bacterium]HOQ84922.1 Nif3-like dinuclear metal center hexameric protein [Phycisphaerae bacterium]
MRRRQFIGSVAASAGLGLAIKATGQADRKETPVVRAADVRDYLLKLGPWVNPNDTVDTFKAGDPQTVVKKIAVAWMPYLWTIQRALDEGCNLLVCHEPVYYNHTDKDDAVFLFEVTRRKKQLIESSGLVIYRCHDVWDRVEGIGIPGAWGEFLGFSKLVNRSTFCHVYEIPETTSGELARSVAGKLQAFGHETVQLIGPADKRVRRIGIGTGAITPFREMAGRLEADLAICTDDGFTFWSDATMAIDMGYPVIVVNHASSEEPGMRKLAARLREVFPSVPVTAIAQECMFRTIRA